MHQKDLVAKAERGERLTKADSRFVLFDSVVDKGEHRHRDREVACNGGVDVLECMDCGRQRTAACTFDEDFA